MIENNAEMPEQQAVVSPEFVPSDKITMQDLTKHMLGPAISLVLHIFLLTVFGTVVVFDPPAKEKELTVEVTTVETVEPPKPPEKVEPPEQQEVTDVSDVEIDRPTTQVSENVSVDVSDVAVSNAVDDVQISTDNLAVKMNNSALKLSSVYAARGTAGRKASVKRYGGTARTEASVDKALAWLAKVQNEDGSWGESGPKEALTGVATLTFLAHGETPQSEKYGKTVEKALRKLADYVDAKDKVDGNGYAQAIVAYAISEGYAMTKISFLERSMNKCIGVIISGMNDLGGYDYHYKKDAVKPDAKTGKLPGTYKAGDPRCDLSLGGWNYQALKAAYAAGCSLEGIEASIDKAIKCIETTSRVDGGGFRYDQSRGASFSMNAVGTLCLQLMGAGNSKAAKDGMAKLESETVDNDENYKLKMDWKKFPKSSMPLYTWYYMTQAIFQGHSGKGKTWDRWNKSFRTTLTKEQSSEGYWDAPKVKYFKSPVNCGADSWVNFGTELGQRVWSTSMCTLMLEVYYRFLPTFQVAHKRAAEDGAGGDAAADNFDNLEL